MVSKQTAARSRSTLTLKARQGLRPCRSRSCTTWQVPPPAGHANPRRKTFYDFAPVCLPIASVSAGFLSLTSTTLPPHIPAFLEFYAGTDTLLGDMLTRPRDRESKSEAEEAGKMDGRKECPNILENHCAAKCIFHKTHREDRMARQRWMKGMPPGDKSAIVFIIGIGGWASKFKLGAWTSLGLTVRP